MWQTDFWKGKGTDKFFFEKDSEPNSDKMEIVQEYNMIVPDCVKSSEKMNAQR